MCIICRQNYCSTCAPRERDTDQSHRICIVCQSISNASTSEDQLLSLRVKHLRCYLQAKNIAHDTCTEKKDLVELILRHRQLPFTHQVDQQQSQSTLNSSRVNNQSGGLTSFQQTMSSFTDQVNNFASNLQDYVSHTVSGVMDPSNNNQPQTRTMSNDQTVADTPTSTPSSTSHNPSVSTSSAQERTTSRTSVNHDVPPSTSVIDR
jgi:hypothetical protein